MLSVLQFRLSSRYSTGNPSFLAIDIDHSDSAREGCTVTTLTITSEPKDWRGAVAVAQQEVVTVTFMLTLSLRPYICCCLSLAVTLQVFEEALLLQLLLHSVLYFEFEVALFWGS